MITLEQVDKLRSYANVSYEDAKLALEEADGDILDAVIYLEKIGKIEKPVNDGKFSTDETEVVEKICQEEKERKKQKEDYGKSDFKKDTRKIIDFLSNLFRLSQINHFEVTRKGEKLISVPIIILIIALMFFFWIVIPLMIFGLFDDCTYSFRGPNIKSDQNPLNQAMDGLKKTADQVSKVFEDEENDGNKKENDGNKKENDEK